MMNPSNELNREECGPARRARSDAAYQQKKKFRFRKKLFRPLNMRGVATSAATLPGPALFRFHF
jgi:hypothetical protein